MRSRTAADAAAVLRFARSGGFEISVRGGGHDVAGLAVAVFHRNHNIPPD